MNKTEFLKALREKLQQELDSKDVESNIRYYSDYIEDAVKNGKPVQEVLDELGDPILIARTIIDTYQSGNRSQSNSYEEYHGTSYNRSTEAEEVKDSFRQFQTRGRLGCFITALIMIAILGVLMFVFSAVVSFILPILLPIFLIVFFVYLFKRR